MDDLNSQPAAPSLPFVRPAEFYESPQTTRLFPRWLPIGCGTASLVFLLVFFIAGAMLASGGAGSLMASLFGTMQSEIDGQFTKDVTPQQRKAFDDAMNGLRAHMKTSRTNFQKLQPLLKVISETTNDDKVTPDEAVRLTQAVREATGK